MTDDQGDIVAFLSTPGAYGPGASHVELHTTHGAMVFLAGERAYKLKRAIRYPYMDYSTAERRKAMCEAELDANRRFAPELYIAVFPVIREPSGALRIGSPGEQEGAIDWLVVMRRFSQDALLENMRKRGALTLHLVRSLAERIAAVHLEAAASREFGGARGIVDVIDENCRILSQMAGIPFDRAKIDRLETLSRSALDRTRMLLDTRRSEGYVRRCHGDLHLNNICLVDGRPVLFDAIEFSDDFACIDVLYDLAFLLMDLDRHDLRAYANILINRYLEQTCDYAGLAVLPLFLSCRAALRAHVVISAAKLDKDGISPARSAEACELLDRAIQYLEPQPKRLIAVGGLSGTGKSTLAAALAPLAERAPGAIVVRTDIVRKQLWGIDELSPLPAAAYRDAFTDRVYATLGERAGLILQGGYCAVADAVFGTEEQRKEIEAVAKDGKAQFFGLWLEAPEARLKQRIAARRNDASDATVEILEAQLANVQKPKHWTTVNADGSASEILARAAAIMGWAAARPAP